MSKKIHPIEREIDRIRLEIYEETKHMTHAEESEYYRKRAEESAKKYGFTIASGTDCE